MPDHADCRRRAYAGNGSATDRCSARSSMPRHGRRLAHRACRGNPTGRCSRTGPNPTQCISRCSTHHDNTTAVATLPCPSAPISVDWPPSSAGDTPRTQHPRPVRTRAGTRARSAAVARSWPLGRTTSAGATAEAPAPPPPVSVPRRGRSRAASDRGRSRARRNHRARPFPLLRQRRNSGATRGAARLRTQGHRIAVVRQRHRARRATRRPRVGRQHGGNRRSRSRARWRARVGRRRARARAMVARADGGTRTDRESSRRHRRGLQRRIVHADARAMRRTARTRAARVHERRSATD